MWAVFPLLKGHKLQTIAHAHTLFIAGRLKREQKNQDLNNILLEKAWNVQCTGVPESPWTDTDVDKECLSRLEEQMFEVSLRAGICRNTRRLEP